MAQSPEFPERIPPEDRPTPSTDSVPPEIVEHAISVATRYARCPACGTDQWFPWTPDEATSTACTDCGEAITVV